MYGCMLIDYFYVTVQVVHVFSNIMNVRQTLCLLRWTAFLKQLSQW